MPSISNEPARSHSSAGRITAGLLLLFLALSPLSAVLAASPDPLRATHITDNILAPGPFIGGGSGDRGAIRGGGAHTFTLRHILHHGAELYPYQLRRLDIHEDTLVATEEDPQLRPPPRLKATSRSRKITRLADRSKDTIENYLWAQRAHVPTTFSADAWTSEEIPQPNITDKATVLSLARIAQAAYVEVEGGDGWMDVGNSYNVTGDFGWEGDGLRGHIFSDETNSTIIIGLKGTSPAVFDGPETTTNDKINDNLLFSCCCARVSRWWKTVCDCFSGTAYTCDNICLKESVTAENRYYRASLNLYYNVTQMYPNANVWLVGHSLGGAVSSLLGQTYGLPVVTFEAPGEALAAQRIGLPKPPGDPKGLNGMSVYHFGVTADPIFMGVCNGPTSGCSIGGYALETRCHAGFECVYDVVSDLGWRVGLGYHRIQSVIKDVIEVYETVPECIFDDGCVDCFNWKYIEGNDTQPTTTRTTSVPTSTSTTTCTSPGWWGCLDPTTTITTTTSPPTITTTTTTTKATTTCTRYGWFGNCLDPSPTTATSTSTAFITITTTSTSTTATETCSHYGFFGKCLDSTTSSPVSATATVTPPVETCKKYNFFGKCADPVETDTPTKTTKTVDLPVPTQTGKNEEAQSCIKRALGGFGWCAQWSSANLDAEL
ncbi:alpha/beta-hydrolase [Morchella conica CCBAS932]|uniref:triacylglycerol lipase n=1 Tax=Morchella conica CCBAS932 TaxID=1392247 RepID=A0A3N4L6B8_9PEZI|nr:alpha/beta-hydrolase [Morchella conica CCBAS932]